MKSSLLYDVWYSKSSRKYLLGLHESKLSCKISPKQSTLIPLLSDKWGV